MTNSISKFILTTIFISSVASAQQSNDPSINFIDGVTKTASDVDVGDGLRAILTLPLVPEQKHLDIEILVFPEFKLDQAPLYEKHLKQEDSDVHGTWQKVFHLPSFRDKADIIARFGRVARLRISWNDNAGNSGTLIRKFYLLEANDQKFFKIVAPGDLAVPNNADPESICSYKKDVAIVGSYIQNPSLSPQEYDFNEDVSLETLRYRGPLNAQAPDTLGYVDSVTPIFQILNPGDLGWLMTGWTHYEGKDTKVSFKPHIVLQAGQGGYFIKETLLKRFKAQKYIYWRKNILHSWQWLPQEMGLLDVGVPQYDFITLAVEDTQDPAKLDKLLADRTAMSSSCKTYPTENDRTFHTGPTNTLNEELYFVDL